MKRRGWVPWMVMALFVGLGFLCYGGALSNPFHFDDVHYIEKNPHIRTVDPVRFFTDPGTLSMYRSFGHYRPLLPLSYSLNYALHGLDPWGYHLVNLLFHVGSSLLLVWVGRLLGMGWGGGVAVGLLYLVHPLHSEGVNYLTARSSVMVAFFVLLGMGAWMAFRQGEPEGRSRLRKQVLYGLSLLAVLGATLSKEVGVLLPVLYWLYDRAFTVWRVWSRSGWRPHLPFLVAMAGLILWTRVGFFGHVVGYIARDWGSQWLTAPRIYLHYLFLWFVPTRLSIDHPVEAVQRLDGTVLLPWSLLFLLGGGALWGLRHPAFEFRIAGFGWLWFFVILAPVSWIPLHDLFQENRGLPGTPGLALATVALVQGILRRLVSQPQWCARVATALVGAVVLVSLPLVWERNRVWQEDLLLWQDALEKNPRSLGARIELARAYARQGNLERAVYWFQDSLRIVPNHYAYNGLGVLALRQGRLDQAANYFQQALDLNPRNTEAWGNLAVVQARRNQPGPPARAFLGALQGSTGKLSKVRIWVLSQVKHLGRETVEKELNRLAQEQPGNHVVWYALGVFRHRAGRLKGAQEALERALRIMPDEAMAWLERSLVALKQQQMDVARQALEQALHYDPENFQIHQVWGVFYLQQGKLAEARAAFQQALSRNPKAYRIRNNLALILAREGDLQGAAAMLEETLRMAPDYGEARLNLARIYESLGRPEQARQQYQALIALAQEHPSLRPLIPRARERLLALPKDKPLPLPTLEGGRMPTTAR